MKERTGMKEPNLKIAEIQVQTTKVQKRANNIINRNDNNNDRKQIKWLSFSLTACTSIPGAYFRYTLSDHK